MKNWLKVTILLCFFGILRELRPSEPFVSEFILGWNNITNEQLNQDVYPVSTYSYLAQLVVIFLLTDFLRFKPVIMMSGICGTIIYSILLWTSSLAWLQTTQFFFGLYMATEVAYLTYIFAKVEPEKYPLVSSLTRMAALSGRFLSGILAQLLVSFEVMDLRQLMYITLTSEILSIFWAAMLPNVKYSVYFHRNAGNKTSAQTNSADTNARDVETYKHNEDSPEEKQSCNAKSRDAFMLIAQHARLAYSKPPIIVWSLFYAVLICLFSQAQGYMQMLWMDIEPDMDEIYNGAVEAVLTLFGACGAYLASQWRHPVVPGILTAVQAASLLTASLSGNIYVSYVGYIVAGICFHYLITQASTKIASQLSDQSCFGLIFGINTLVGTALQAILTIVIISNAGLALPIRQQYYVVSGSFAVVSITWFVGWILYATKHPKTISESNIISEKVDKTEDL